MSTNRIESIESAATILHLEPNALRARCRRAARRTHEGITAQLGGGIVAFKFGRSWRVRIPVDVGTATTES